MYYSTGPKEIFVPRAILCDLEPGVLHQVKCSTYGRIYNPDYFIMGRSGAGNNWATGHYSEGAELMDCVLEASRRQVECCDCLQGFQMVHSIGGGTGSGMGSLLMHRLKDDYPTKIVNTYSIFPSEKVSETVVEPYNAVLTLCEMVNGSDESICIDNEALFDICHNKLKICNPALPDLNHLVSMTMAGITTCFRYPGQLNTDLNKLLTNMCPYPKIHFFIPGFAPIASKCSEIYKRVTTCELISQLFDGRNQMAAVDPCHGQYLTCATIFRGLVSTREVDDMLISIQEKTPDLFVKWIPNNIKSAICDIPPRGFKLSATFVANTSAIQCLFERLLCQFRTMFHKRAFIHWYTGEGMDEAEFCAAEEALVDLIQEYKCCEDVAGDECDSCDSSTNICCDNNAPTQDACCV